MDDMMNKIGEILSDPESVKQIAELAQIFMSETSGSDKNVSDESSAEANKKSENESDGLFSGFDFGKLLKLQEIAGAVSGKDKNAELLLALKPHLSPDKQKKADKAIKILKLLTIWNIIKDSGLLKDFLN